MKIRCGFISNSSSTSFISYSDEYREDTISISIIKKMIYDNSTLIVDSSIGCIEFGFGPDDIYGLGSKIIFAYLQTGCGKNEDRLQLLESTLKEKFNIDEIEWKISNETSNSIDFGYIDHASSYEENKNIEIFNDKNSLDNFLFNYNVFIHLDSDS